jgi:hypothetical protein
MTNEEILREISSLPPEGKRLELVINLNLSPSVS